MNANSAAAAVITAARQAFWPLVLKPKLGDDWRLYRWGEKAVRRRRDRHPLPAAMAPARLRQLGRVPHRHHEAGPRQPNTPPPTSRPGNTARSTRSTSNTRSTECCRGSRAGPEPARSRWHGDVTTVDQMGGQLGPSQRLTVDWSNLDNSTENIVYGQSGNPLSPWYRDQWPYWYGRTTFTLPFSEQAIAAGAKHTLRLTP